MSAFFLHEGVNIEYSRLRSRMHPQQYLVATWLTERNPLKSIHKAFVEIITSEQAFQAFMQSAREIIGLYHLRFFASNEPHRSYFDYNPTKGPVFIDRKTPHWEAMNYYDLKRFTARPDDITVLTLEKQRCIPFCAPFALKLEFDWLEIVPGFQLRRVAETATELKYRLLDCNGYILESKNILETAQWSNATKVLQLRKSQSKHLETEFRYQD